MITWIARRELLEHVRSTRFFALSLLCVLLLPATTYVNVSGVRSRQLYAQELEERRLIASEPAGSLNDQGASRFGWRSGVVAPDPALRAIRQPQPEEVLAIGLSLEMPAYWQFSTEGVEEGRPPDSQGGEVSLGGSMDVASLIQMVLGLLAILIAFDSVSGELESGRMRTILAHPVSRAEVLAGKFVGAYASLTVPLGVGVFASYIIMWLRGLPVFEVQFIGSTVGIIVASMIYLATMLALGIAVSALTREARTSLVILLVIWVCTTLAIPSAAVLTSAAISSTQPAELMRASIAGNMKQLEHDRAERLAEVWETVSGSRAVPNDGNLSPELKDRYLAAAAPIEQAMAARKRNVIESLRSARDRQLDIQRGLQVGIGRLSPAISFLRAAQALAGTGDAMQSRWKQEIAGAQHSLETASFDRQFGVELFAADQNYERIVFWPDPTDEARRVPHYDELPTFRHHQQELLEAVAAAAPDLCLLALECVALMLVAALAYFRVDV